MSNYSFLESDRLYLRPFEDGDEDFFMKWYNDKDTRAKIGEVMPFSKFQAEQLVRRKNKDSIWFAIVRKEDNEVIGETGLLRMFPAWRTTDLSIIKIKVKDMVLPQLILSWTMTFGYLSYNRISVGVVGFNTYALNFYKKVGF